MQNALALLKTDKPQWKTSAKLSFKYLFSKCEHTPHPTVFFFVFCITCCRISAIKHRFDHSDWSKDCGAFITNVGHSVLRSRPGRCFLKESVIGIFAKLFRTPSFIEHLRWLLLCPIQFLESCYFYIHFFFCRTVS